MSYLKSVLMDNNEGLYIDVTDLMNRLNNIRLLPKASPSPEPKPEVTDYKLHFWSPIHIGDPATFRAWKIACVCTYDVTTNTEEPWKNATDEKYWNTAGIKIPGIILKGKKLESKKLGVMATSSKGIGKYVKEVSGVAMPVDHIEGLYTDGTYHEHSIGFPIGGDVTEINKGKNIEYTECIYASLGDYYIYLKDTDYEALKETDEISSIQVMEGPYYWDAKHNVDSTNLKKVSPKDFVKKYLFLTKDDSGSSTTEVTKIDTNDTYELVTLIKDFTIYTIELPDKTEMTLNFNPYTTTMFTKDWNTLSTSSYYTLQSNILYTNIAVGNPLYNNCLKGIYYDFDTNYDVYTTNEYDGQYVTSTDLTKNTFVIYADNGHTSVNLGFKGEDITVGNDSTNKVWHYRVGEYITDGVYYDSISETTTPLDQCRASDLALVNGEWYLIGTSKTVNEVTIKSTAHYDDEYTDYDGSLHEKTYDYTEYRYDISGVYDTEITVTTGEVASGYVRKEYYIFDTAENYTLAHWYKLENTGYEDASLYDSSIKVRSGYIAYTTSNNVESIKDTITVLPTKFSSCYNTDSGYANNHIIAFFIKDTEGFKLLGEYCGNGNEAYVTPCQGSAYIHLDKPGYYYTDHDGHPYIQMYFHSFRTLTEMFSQPIESKDGSNINVSEWLPGYITTISEDSLRSVSKCGLRRSEKDDEAGTLTGVAFVNTNKSRLQMNLWDTEKEYYAKEPTEKSFWKTINGSTCYNITAGLTNGTSEV